MKPHSSRAALLAVLAAAVLAAGCTGGGNGGTPATKAASAPATAAPTTAAPTTTPPPASVRVRLSEFAIDLGGATTAHARTVTFRVANAGKAPHEFVVLRTRTAAAKLPVAKGEASEAGNIGEVGDLKAGGRDAITLRLAPGHYAFICNLAGHYQAGMHTDFTVVG